MASIILMPPMFPSQNQLTVLMNFHTLVKMGQNGKLVYHPLLCFDSTA